MEQLCGGGGCYLEIVLVDSHSQSQFHTDFSFRCGYISSPDFQLSVEKCSKLSSNEFCFKSFSVSLIHFQLQPVYIQITAGQITAGYLDQFQFRWLNIKGFDTTFPISITLFSNHLK